MKVKISDSAVFSSVLRFKLYADPGVSWRISVRYVSSHFLVFTLQLTVEDRLTRAAQCFVMLK